MSTSHGEERFRDELREVADALRDQRPTLDPLTLDAIKLRAMSRRRRSPSSQAKGVLMRSRLTTLLTVGFLCLGTGGALAVVGGVPPFSSSDEGSASCTQYRPGNGFGDKNHCHTGPPGQTGEHPGNGNGNGNGNGHGH